jgi:hypothetical protein
MGSGPGPSDDAVRALAREILDRPEYSYWRPGKVGEWLEWFAKLFDTNPVLFWEIVAALALTLLAIVVHVVWTLRKGLAMTPDGGDVVRADDRPRFADEAEALARRGRFVDASRAMQLGAIDRLVRAGHLRLGRGDPNTVLRRRLGETTLADDVRRDLLAAVAELERRWFRDRVEDEALYHRWRRVHAALDTTLTAA